MAKILAQVLCTVALLLVNSRLRTSTCRLVANYLVRIALVQLSKLIPWEDLETEYADGFSLELGAPAKPFRMVLGALIIKERLGTSDAETVEQIRENPYLQYFLGLSEYTNQAPFDASMLVHFRKRLSLEIVGHINERIVLNALASSSKTGTETTNEGYSKQENEEGEVDVSNNQGQLILDASCAPADIRYPTDLSLLNEAREHTETIIDLLYEQVKEEVEKKPRTYRQQARQEYLKIAKQRKVNHKTRRKAIRKQLGYLRRNLAHIDALIAQGASLSQLDPQLYRKLLVISELYRQQQWMYQHRQRRIDDRIVSLSQPHVRPIVRGKAGTPVEFGAKVSVSCVEGHVFLDHLSWDNFNESGDLPQQVEQFRQRFGHYPASVHADQIYHTRANRAYCRQRGIRLSGKPLGRPAALEQAELRQQAREDAKIRNQIEGKFGQGKRRFSLARVMDKLASTAATTIAITFLVMNLERLLRQLLFVLVGSVLMRKPCMEAHGQRHTGHPSQLLVAA
jgi:transposase, IS5 family